MKNGNGSYDIVLANGRVINPETYLDGKMHVGIKGDRIAAVSGVKGLLPGLAG
jgi:predicted amidohydrolase YtcJ